MMQTIYKFSVATLLLTSLLFTSCGDSKISDTYQCPMKCEDEKTYTQAGKCPECKMDLKGIETKK